MSSCQKCNGSGLLPFYKGGKVVPNAFVHCDCYDPHSSHVDITPGDFDFPMSATYRAHSYEYCNQVDPGYIPPVLAEVSPKQTESAPNKDGIVQLRTLLSDLQNRLNKHIDRIPKGRDDGGKSNYKGIR